MSNAIGNAITDDKGNSLSPEPCALIPSVAKAKANLTVGTPETPAIVRPDVDAVGMAIDHLDFEPLCDARHAHERGGAPLAEVIVVAKSCPCVPTVRLWCRPCLEWTLRWSRWRCRACGYSTSGCLVIHWEPLR